MKIQTHLARAIDPAVPSNRQILLLGGAFLAAASVAGWLRSPDDAERELLDAIRVGDSSLYGRFAAALVALPGSESTGVHLLRGVNALLGASTLVATWALARELLPDQPALAAPAALLAVLQPGFWLSSVSAGPAASEALSANGLLMIFTRILTRSTGCAPTPLDDAMVIGATAWVALLRDELRPLLALPAIVALYDAARDTVWGRAALEIGGVGIAAAGVALGGAFVQPATRSALPAGAVRALAGLRVGGLFGAVTALALHRSDLVRSHADNGTPITTASVQAARLLALGWTALHAARRTDSAAATLNVLAPLCVGAAAGVAALVRRLSAAGE